MARPVLVTLVAAWALSCASGPAPEAPGPQASTDAPIRVSLWTDPATIRHSPRFAWTWEDPAALAPFRAAEGLDGVVAGASTDEERARRLVAWSRRQFPPGRPDPYPPPDAVTLLAEIRSGRTGGFCAQHCFLAVQALQAVGLPARDVTVGGHEVIEAWLTDERRWVMLDALHDLQVEDAAGRSLSVLEIWESLDAGRPLGLRHGTLGMPLGEDEAAYLARFRRAGVWLHAAFTTRPVNFADFRRYRVWYRPAPGGLPVPEAELQTPHPADLWSPPSGAPSAR
jgi:hypothetical protein